MSELESRRRHPSNPRHAEALHERMSDRLHMLRREYEGLGEVADQTRGITGWLFRREVKRMMGRIEEMEIEMANTNVVPLVREFCSHGVLLEDCTMPLCIEIKAGRHYRAQKRARRDLRNNGPVR